MAWPNCTLPDNEDVSGWFSITWDSTNQCFSGRCATVARRPAPASQTESRSPGSSRPSTNPATPKGRASKRWPRRRGSSRRIFAKNTGTDSRLSFPLSLAPAWRMIVAAEAASGVAASRQPIENATNLMRVRLWSTEQFGGDLGDVAPLEPGPVTFNPRRLPGTVARGNGRGPIRAAPGDFLERVLALEAVGQADRDQSEVHQVGKDGEQGHFLSAVLGCGRGECTADLPIEGTRCPQAATLVEEIGHLRRHAAETRAAADDDRVVLRQVRHLRDRGRLVELVARVACDLFG